MDFEEFVVYLCSLCDSCSVLKSRPTFRRIIRNGSTEMFSGLPYIYSLLNCLICMWYGTPLISADNLLVTTVNSIGAVFQFVYTIIFLMYAEKAKKVNFLILLEAYFVDIGQSSVISS